MLLGVSFVEEKCPSCGGPLPAASVDWLTCKFCGAELRPAPGAQYHIWPKVPEPPYAPENERIEVAGIRYCVLGRLARDVVLARKDERLTEMVIVKRGANIQGEWKNIEAIAQGDRDGDSHFKRLLPQLVVRDDKATVYRWRSGFQWTFEDVLAEHKGGVDAKAAVWMWKRVLDTLGWLHKRGFVHGAIAPSHLLIHPRDHGVVMCGWSSASRSPSTEQDVGASAKAISFVLGIQAAPPSIAKLLQEQSTSPSKDAWAVKDMLDAAAYEAYGPPRYHRFQMAGWG